MSALADDGSGVSAGPALGVDVGGTKMLAGIVAADGSLAASRRADTPPMPAGEAALEAAVADLAGSLLAEHEVVAVGLGIGGLVDAAGERVRFAPHLAWRDVPVRERLAERLGRPVRLENDANAALWAEHRFGVAHGVSSVLLVNLGTGIGGAVMVDGVLVRGAHGLSGEVGHVTVVPDGLACECGGRGCWEQYASGNALLRLARGLVAAGDGELARLCDGDAAALSGTQISEAAAAGNTEALEALSVVADWLGVGIANLVATLDPGLVVVGGGLSAAGELLFQPARAAMRRSLVGAGDRPEPPVVPTRLGVAAGCVGAADLARQGTHR